MNTLLLTELDAISSLLVLKKDDLDAILEEIGWKIIDCLEVDRVSVWLFDEDKTRLTSIGEIDRQLGTFEKGKILKRKSSPSYFQALFRDQVLHVPDVQRSTITKELNEHYNIPYSITSLVDVPLRISAEAVGVICFERKFQVKPFQEDEISFAQSVAQVCAAGLEARKRRTVQHQLEKELDEKNRILNELHHRLQNDYSILTSIIQRRTSISKDQEIRSFGELLQKRVQHLASIQDILQRSISESGVNCSYFFRRLYETQSDWPNWFRFEIEHDMSHVSSKTAVYLGGILLELAECMRPYSSKFEENKVIVQLKSFADSYSLEVSCNVPLETLFSLEYLRQHVQYVQDLCEEARISYTCDITLPLFLKLFFKKEF